MFAKFSCRRAATQVANVRNTNQEQGRDGQYHVAKPAQENGKQNDDR